MKNMTKQEKFDCGILIAHILNILLVLLISLGLFDGIESFSFVLFLSLTLVMICLISLKWYNIKTNKEGKKVFEYIPFMSMTVLELIYGIKMVVGINEEGQMLGIFAMLAFVLVNTVAALIYKDKCEEDINKKLIAYSLAYAAFLMFILVFMIIVLDYGFI